MVKVKVFVTLKESVIDPQGKAALDALKSMEYSDLKDVRFGKYIELSFEEAAGNLEEKIHEICRGLLVNEEVEEYRFEIEEVVAR